MSQVASVCTSTACQGVGVTLYGWVFWFISQVCSVKLKEKANDACNAISLLGDTHGVVMCVCVLVVLCVCRSVSPGTDVIFLSE